MNRLAPFEWITAIRFMQEGKVQTLLIITGVALGVGVIVFMSALVEGMQANIIRRTLNYMAPIVVIKAIVGLTSMFGGSLVAQGAHQVPMAAFSAEAMQLFLLLLARSALATLVLTLFCVLVLIRYRAMIPLTYVLLLLQHAGNVILLFKESVITGTSSATVVNVALLLLTAVGLVSSLHGRPDPESTSRPA